MHSVHISLQRDSVFKALQRNLTASTASLSVCSNQEPDDLKGQIQEAYEEENATTQAIIAYENTVDAFIQAGCATATTICDDDSAVNTRGNTIYRKKALLWARCFDHQCSHLGVELSWFQKRGDGDPLEWPLLVISPDQGLDGRAALNYFKNSLKLNIIVAWDPNHGAWNDAKCVLKLLGLWPFVSLCAIAMSLQHGPWEENRWFETLLIAAKEVKTHLKPDNKLFQMLLPGMLKDAGTVVCLHMLKFNWYFLMQFDMSNGAVFQFMSKPHNDKLSNIKRTRIFV